MPFLGFHVDSSQAITASVNLDKMTKASQQAENAAERLRAKSAGASAGLQSVSNAANAQAAAMQAAAAKAQVHTAAMQANSAATARNTMMQRNLMYQMVDMGQALPLLLSGNIYGLQNMGFQIAQIGQMYYGNGGMGQALKDMTAMLGGAVTRIAPVAAAVGALATISAAARSEIEDLTGASVSFGDMAGAAWEMMAERVTSAFGGAIEAVGGFFSWVWEQVEDFAVSEFNAIAAANDQLVAQMTMAGTIIGATWEAAKARTQAIWEQLPGVMGDIAFSTANSVLQGIESMINGAIDRLNEFTAGARGFLAELNINVDRLGHVDLPDVDNPFAGRQDQFRDTMTNIAAGQASAIAEAVAVYQAEMERINSTDYFGDFARRASDIAAARAEMEALTNSTSAANDNAKSLGDTLSDAARRAQQGWDQFRGWFTGMFTDFGQYLSQHASEWETVGDGIRGVFAAATNAVGNFFSNLGNHLLQMAGNQVFNMLFGGMMGASGSWGMTPGGNFFTPSAFVPGGFFPGLPSFDGGGFTGMAPRSGGLDGKGGFPALLHPREIVTDLTRPANQNHVNDNRRGDINITINGSGLSEQQLARAIGDALTSYDNSLAGKVEGKFRTMQNDPRAADGRW